MVRPVRAWLVGVAATATVVWSTPSATGVSRYPVTGLPPLTLGGCQDSVACVPEPVRLTAVGAPSVPAGITTALDSGESGPNPTVEKAATRKV